MASLDGHAKNIKQNGPQIHILYFCIFWFPRNMEIIIGFSEEKAKNAKLKIVLKKKNFQHKCRHYVGKLSWNFKNSQQLTFFESEKVAQNPYLYRMRNFALIIRKNKSPTRFSASAENAKYLHITEGQKIDKSPKEKQK